MKNSDRRKPQKHEALPVTATTPSTSTESDGGMNTSLAADC